MVASARALMAADARSAAQAAVEAAAWQANPQSLAQTFKRHLRVRRKEVRSPFVLIFQQEQGMKDQETHTHTSSNS